MTDRAALSTYQLRLLNALAAHAPDGSATAAELAVALAGPPPDDARRIGRNGNAAQHLRRLAAWGYVAAAGPGQWQLTEQGWATHHGWVAD